MTQKNKKEPLIARLDLLPEDEYIEQKATRLTREIMARKAKNHE